jgi:hypothetical protein
MLGLLALVCLVLAVSGGQAQKPPPGITSTLIAQPPPGQPVRLVIPRSWDDAELEAWTVPPRQSGVYTVH